MIIQATNRNKIIVAALTSLVILTATINLVGFKWFDIDVRDFIEGFVVGISLVFIAIWILALITIAVKRRNQETVEAKDLGLNKRYLSIGMLCLVVGTILNRLDLTGEWIHFVAGVLFISSIIFNLMYLVGLRKVKKE